MTISATQGFKVQVKGEKDSHNVIAIYHSETSGLWLLLDGTPPRLIPLGEIQRAWIGS